MAVALAATGACGVSAEGPPHIEVDRTPCAQCGMLISEPVFAAAYRVPGFDARAFDDIGCLLASVKREPDPAVIRFWFHDVATGNWISGHDATFVHAVRLHTPMSGHFVAYGDAAVAERAALDHRGRVIRSLSDLLRGAQ